MTYRFLVTLKNAVNILLLSCIAFGAFIIPKGDFTVLTDLQQMSRHYEALQGKVIASVDFIKSHIMRLQAQSGNHKSGSHQKPHTPIQTHHRGHNTISYIQLYPDPHGTSQLLSDKPSFASANLYGSDFVSRIFHPPTV